MKRYGIRIRMPEDATFRMPHLLGPDWEAFRWYETEEAREHAYAEITADLPIYRKGDRPAQIVERIERDA
ncbi:hypothetical protein [Thioalkalivibrio sp. ALJ24]|uniref:hypothetical protein n=1 Tax=Thioalkalivibrio sp. ALJ24 TaxID=545276 RepID=UPI0004772A68|nr:hypothetical protein [Thioalkalivibrio sp. ALJ24]